MNQSSQTFFVFFFFCFISYVDLTNSYGYYGSLSFPLRPPSPFADGLRWSNPMSLANDQDNSNNEIYIWPAKTKHFSMHYNINTNNNNNNNYQYDNLDDPIGIHSSSTSPKRFWNRLLKRSSPKKASSDNDLIDHPYDFGHGDLIGRSVSKPVKRVHWIDDDEAILKICYRFVEHLKLFVQHILNDYYDDEHSRQCQTYLNELNRFTDSSELQRAFDESLAFANEGDKVRLLRQQTFIAQLISRTILSS